MKSPCGCVVSVRMVVVVLQCFNFVLGFCIGTLHSANVLECVHANAPCGMRIMGKYQKKHDGTHTLEARAVERMQRNTCGTLLGLQGGCCELSDGYCCWVFPYCMGTMYWNAPLELKGNVIDCVYENAPCDMPVTSKH